MSDTRTDAFLGGRLRILQEARGYRAGADPVLLAAAVPAKPGDSVLELGTGVGTALLCLMARVEGLDATGIERDENAVALARRNVRENDFEAEIIAADIAELPREVTERSFDHVLFNPPFFDRGTSSPSPEPAREAGRGAAADLSLWVDQALPRLRPGGRITLIHRVEALPATLEALGKRAGDQRVLPLAPRANRAARLFILGARKGSNAPFNLLPPFILHRGDRHERDSDSYTRAASDILRNGAALPLSH